MKCCKGNYIMQCIPSFTLINYTTFICNSFNFVTLKYAKDIKQLCFMCVNRNRSTYLKNMIKITSKVSFYRNKQKKSIIKNEDS